MEETESVEKPRRKIDTGIAIGVIAIVINVITVTVYMYQAKIMQSQQHAAAWPYLEWLTSINEEQGLYIELKNNGIGPAIIKSTVMKLNGEVVNADSLFVKLIGTNHFPHLSSAVKNRVLPAGSSIKPFHITDIIWAYKIFAAMNESKFEFEVCYESIYGDQWTTVGTEVVESVCK